mmetsp:Transcript_32926/g.52614  ORF Transcript_32926/g.52614 Transcript_32926/m.52614 type:complete len:513 (-) Transcript_32926:577-2115(-)
MALRGRVCGRMGAVKLEDLPRELLVAVLVMVADGPRQVAAVSEVCKRLEDAARDRRVWLAVFKSRFVGSSGGEPFAPTPETNLELHVDSKAREFSTRTRKWVAGGSWLEVVKGLTTTTPDLLQFHGFYTDGGHDENIPGTLMRRRHWMGNVFRGDCRGFYCSEKAQDILVCGILGNDRLDPETIDDRRSHARRTAMLACLKGSFYDISTSASARRRASTNELESRFLDIVNTQVGLNLLVTAKFGWRSLGFPLTTEAMAEKCAAYRESMLRMAEKIHEERRNLVREDAEAISEGRDNGINLAIKDSYVLDDSMLLETVCPGVLERNLVNKDGSHSFALIQSISIEREGSFTCPVRCGAVFTCGESLGFEDQFAAEEFDGDVRHGHRAAKSVSKQMHSLRQTPILQLLNGARSYRELEKLIRDGCLPKVVTRWFPEHVGAFVVEFAPTSEPVDVVLWFCFMVPTVTRIDIKLSQPRTTRYLISKLACSENEFTTQQPNIDISGIYAHGHVLKT